MYGVALIVAGVSLDFAEDYSFRRDLIDAVCPFFAFQAIPHLLWRSFFVFDVSGNVADCGLAIGHARVRSGVASGDIESIINGVKFADVVVCGLYPVGERVAFLAADKHTPDSGHF